MSAIDFSTFGLPAYSMVGPSKDLLQTHDTVVISAPPGAGKSTLLPLTWLNEHWLGHKKIIMLEPRRLAAKSIAQRMADMLNEAVGETVGYRIRFEQKTSKYTRLEIVTEGILTRMLQQNNSLDDVGMIIFDEFHERSIHADLAFALCREVQHVLRPDLRMVIMSATLNIPRLLEVLQCPVLESTGKLHHVAVHHLSDADPTLLPELAPSVVRQAASENEGDILLFLPGESEIKRCAEKLKTMLPAFSIHPLYGMMPIQEQSRAIRPHPDGKRKVVLATSIAETSLTIEGIRTVIDSGFARVSRYDPVSGLSRLETVRVTLDAAEQRAGRAGRLTEGTCYRMWSAATHHRLHAHRIPEILEADLTALVLELFAWGISNIAAMQWLTPPPPAAVAVAIQVLEQIGAIENNGITEHGKAIHAIPCHPRLAHMLLKAKDDECIGLAADIAALIEERDILDKESAGIDLNKRLVYLRRNRERQELTGKLGRIEKVAAQYRKLMSADMDNDTQFDAYETGLLLAYAFPERIACARVGNNVQFHLANGKIGTAGHRDDLAHEPWLAIAHMDARQGLGKIFLAAPLNPKDLLPMVRKVKQLRWDTHKGGLQASEEWRVGSIILKAVPLKDVQEVDRLHAILEAVKTDGTRLLDWNETTSQWQNRILSLQKWNDSSDWPDASTDSLLAKPDWLIPFIGNAKSNADLYAINLMEALPSLLSWEQQQLLQKLAPEFIQVPSGSRIRVHYLPDGQSPILAVRLQELFGQQQTPHVNLGKTPVVLQLLSPGYKPVQVTTDLHSFWKSTYFEVRKELQRRYPKHAWPDEPYTAKAVAKGGIKK